MVRIIKRYIPATVDKKRNWLILSDLEFFLGIFLLLLATRAKIVSRLHLPPTHFGNANRSGLAMCLDGSWAVPVIALEPDPLRVVTCQYHDLISSLECKDAWWFPSEASLGNHNKSLLEISSSKNRLIAQRPSPLLPKPFCIFANPHRHCSDPISVILLSPNQTRIQAWGFWEKLPNPGDWVSLLDGNDSDAL